MKSPKGTEAGANRRVRLDIILIVAACVAFLGVVFIPGLRLAKSLSNDASALKFVSERRSYTLAVRNAVETLQDRLDSGGYVQAPLDQLRKAGEGLSDAVTRMSGAREIGVFDTPTETTALADPQIKASVTALDREWSAYRAHLAPLVAFHGIPFYDSESAGTHLNPEGRKLADATTLALQEARQAIPRMDADFIAVTDALEKSAAASTSRLSLVMLVGLVLAATMVSFAIMLQLARKKQEEAVRDAQAQMQRIFATMKEGLFLLDRDLVIGSAYSAATKDLFKRDDLAGLSFEELLKGLVPEKTLDTAMKFARVLWSERTKENLVKSINPLGEVEVRFQSEAGGASTQYLEFDFHRVRAGDDIAYLLVSVSDVSARVALANELKASQEKTQAQIDTLLNLLRVDPNQLSSFLGDSDAALQMVNSILREPAREEAAFRKKVDSMFRQIHAIKGEAAAIGLTTVEERAHGFEENLRALREKRELTGNDFLPLIVKLDDLFTHMQSIRELLGQLSRLQEVVRNTGRAPAAGAKPARATKPGAGESTIIEPLAAGADLAIMLKQLAERVGLENGKAARVEIAGAAALPNAYRRVVKDIAVQAVRNAVMHGIEAPQARRDAGKDPCGVIRIEVADQGAEGYRLTIEDDGQGLATEKIIASAVQKGLVSEAEAATFGPKQVMRLLFRPGFSTYEKATKDAGRGVGMNLIANLVNESGGKIGVSTSPGKFTRFTINLPATSAAGSSHEAA